MELNKIIDKCKENKITGICLAHFLAQTDHESCNFTKFKESENYRYKTAKIVFKKYIALIESKQNELKDNDNDFIPQPYFFNVVYSNRMGNNNEEGYKFRGRGLIQLTGKYNYQQFAKYKNMELEQVIKYLETEDGIIESSIWFWNINNLNELAIKNDINGITKKINGGLNGINERIKLLDKYKKIIN